LAKTKNGARQTNRPTANASKKSILFLLSAKKSPFFLGRNIKKCGDMAGGGDASAVMGIMVKKSKP
jgi:hypothetical protein